MSSLAPTLPSDSDITSADAAKRRSLVMQAFSYGTDYDRWPRDASTLPERSKEAAAVLVKAWSSSPLMESMLADVLWLVESLVPQDDEDESYQALVHIVTELASVPHQQEFLSRLQGTLDPALLEASHVLPQGGKETLVKRLRKLNTDMYYRQQKYNLLQEESEGYAKLLTLLLTAGEHNDDGTLSSSIRECMAAFELDPNRVLDLVLDILESQIEDSSANNEALLKLMQDFCLPKVPHLLGFKLSNYKDEVPSSLYKTVCLLAKNNLLNIATLLPHLSPISEIEAAYKTCQTCERQGIRNMGRIRLSGGKQDHGDAERVAKVAQAKATTAQNMRVGLALVFLQQGEWKLVLQVLEGAEVCSQVCTLLPDTFGSIVCGLIQTAFQPIYQALVQPPCLNNGDAATNGCSTKGVGTLTASPSLQDVTQVILEPLLCIVDSGCIQSQPILYCQLCRLVGALLNKNGSTEKLSRDTYTLLKSFLVPCLSLFPPNPAVSAELWSVLSLLPYSTRYRLYRDWCGPGLEKDGINGKPLCLVGAEAQAGKAARYTLKRLSKDNVRDMGRQVAKVTHSNPLVVFTTILNQIEAYDNLIQMMVETVRFVTPLSLDVLGYCVLSRLSGSSDVSRSRMKGDGVNVSQWLASLESFAGAFYKKCPDVECRGILSYLIRRLKDGSVVELGVLRTLLNTAGGYSFADYTSAASLSEIQLEGRSGSQLLKRETFAFGVVEALNRRSSQRLRSVLQSDGMGVTVLILLAQVRSRVLFHEAGRQPKPIKLIGNLFDTCQVVMGLLLEFLTDSTEEEEQAGNSAIAKYAEFMPTLDALHEQYGLDPAAAWMLCRPLIRAATDDSQKKSGRNKLTKLDMALRKYRPTEAATKKFLPETAWTLIAPALFDFFFSYAMYDISCPESCYETEISRLSKEVERLTQHQKGGAGAAAQKSVLAATAASAGATEMEIRRAMAFSKADELELERAKRNSAALTSDLATQKRHCAAVRQNLNSNKDKLLPSDKVSPSAAMTFLTHCIYPRCTLSPDDALYCAKFVFLLHELETPGFGTLYYLDELVNAIAGTLFCVSEGEAANMALLLWKTWSVVSKWRYDEEAYATEVANKPGSFMVKPIDSIAASEEESSEEADSVTYEEYKALYNKWHATIGQAALGCLKSPEYMHNRACLIVLTRIVDVYPTRPVLGQKLMDALAPLQEDSNPLKDIMAMAQSYGFQITKARGDGVWKEEDAAVAKARLDKEKAAVEARKKKAAKQLAEMKRESDKIADELGDSRGRGRDDRRRPPSRAAGPGSSRIQSPLNPSAPNFEPPKGQSMPPSRLGNSDSTRDGGRRGRDEQWGRVQRDGDRRPGYDGLQSGLDDSRRSGRGGHPGGLEGRWQLGSAQPGRENSVGQKRGRSPVRDATGPGDGGGRDEHLSKRPRLDRDGREGGGRDGYRGPDSRGGSRPASPLHRGARPVQRGPPPPPPPPRSQQHGDRGGSRPDRRGRR